MKRQTLAFVLAASALLAGCNNTQVYAVSANAQGSADALYVAAEKAGEVLVASGKLTPTQFGTLADKAYTALQAFRNAAAAFRAASSAGTSTSSALAAQTQALADFNAALHDFQTVVGVTPTSATAI